MSVLWETLVIEEITPLILTYNEAPNIQRTCDRLQWAKRIVVIDSFSTDQTLEILATYSQVEVLQRQFNSFADQCNYGLSKIISEWVLSLDADYLLTDELLAEILALQDVKNINGYSAKFKYCVFGSPLRGTLLPSRKVLYRRLKATYVNDGHAHRVQIEGHTEMLSGYIFHDDRKPLSRWLWAQDRYMVIEAQKLLNTPENDLSFADRVRKRKYFAPWAILFYCLFLKGGIFDGWRGWYYALQRVFAEILLSIRLLEYEQTQLNSQE